MGTGYESRFQLACPHLKSAEQGCPEETCPCRPTWIQIPIVDDTMFPGVLVYKVTHDSYQELQHSTDCFKCGLNGVLELGFALFSPALHVVLGLTVPKKGRCPDLGARPGDGVHRAWGTLSLQAPFWGSFSKLQQVSPARPADIPSIAEEPSEVRNDRTPAT